VGRKGLAVLAVMTAGALVGCSEPDPKEECVRYLVEFRQIERKWSARPPVGLSVVEEAKYQRRYEMEHPDYAVEQRKLKEQFENRLRTSNVDMFCQSYW
jgi:hypothetical protein